MRLSTALKYAAKYHAMAFVPTLIGALIVAGAVWFGVGQYVLEAVQAAGGSPTALLRSVVGAVLNSASPLLVVAGVLVGYFVRRVGKTALLVRANAQAVETARANATDEVSPAPAEAVEDDASAVETPPATDSVETGTSASPSDAIATGSLEDDPVESAVDEPAADDGSDAAVTSDFDEAETTEEATSGGFDDTWARADEAMADEESEERAENGDRDDRQ